MSLLDNIRKCVSKRHGLQRRLTRVLFNVKITDSFKSRALPSQLKSLLVYIARDGVAVTDLFRRPGNPQDMKKIIADLENGRPINWSDYSFYTLANIAKRFLLHVEGGILGPKDEELLLSMLDSPDDQARIEAMHRVIVSQPEPVQHLLALLFGIWFRMIYHTEVNAMSVEAVAKSVAGSVFPSCTISPEKVEQASKAMEYLITGFASADLFSRDLIEYFTTETKTSISRIEKFKYEFRFPKDVPREKSIRLFMRLLLEESRKHGFHVVNDAVSKETFENACWENACVLLPPMSDVSTESSNLTNDVQCGHDCPSKRLLMQPAEEASRVAGGIDPNDPANNDAGAVRPPSSQRRLSNRISSEAAANGPVQQTSEKRTCVTTTPLRCQQAELSDGPMFQPTTVDQVSFPVLDSPSANPLITQCTPQFPGTARPVPIQPSGFNSVKRRQLERLQKRSDWFLSPPAGLRSSGLMHLDPNSSKSVHLPNATNHCGTSTLANRKDRDRKLETIDSSDLALSLSGPLYVDCAADFVDGEQEPIPTDAEYSIEAADQQQLFMDPVRLWSNGSFSSADRTEAPPNATSSPKPLNGQAGDEKENFPEVETRYFVVQRYYGPEAQGSRFTKPTRIPDRPLATCLR